MKIISKIINFRFQNYEIPKSYDTIQWNNHEQPKGGRKMSYCPVEFICAKQLRVAPLQFTMKDGAMILRQDARARPVRVSPLSVLAEFSTVSQRFDEQAGGLVVKTNAETGTFLEKAFTDPSLFYQDWEKKLEEVGRVIRPRGTS